MAFREKTKDGTTRITGGVITMAQIMNALNPIGSIYMSVVNTNPAAVFGGTWVAWGSGRVPVGVDGTQVEFDTVEETGGNKLETISVAQMPSHDHGGATGITDPNVRSSLSFAATDPATPITVGRGTAGANVRTMTDHAHSHTITPQGSGLGHANLQPYITCYMWKRTA